MNITRFIPNAVTRTVGRQTLIAGKHAPNILFGLGVTANVVGTVLACRATLKLPAILDEARDDIQAVKKDMPEGIGPDYTSHDYRRDIAYAQLHALGRIGRIYAPAVLVSGAGFILLTKSHTTLTNRNKALTVAYAGLHTAYENYRERVREQIGEEKELDIYHSVTKTKVKGEDGKMHEVNHADPNSWSPHARFFDEASRAWNKDPEINRLFVQAQQNYLNDLLHTRGHVFLNEAYDALGIERSSAGQVVGWVIGNTGDNYIDFGIFEAFNSRFVNGVERSILLDFNVDGVIYDKIG